MLLACVVFTGACGAERSVGSGSSEEEDGDTSADADTGEPSGPLASVEALATYDETTCLLHQDGSLDCRGAGAEGAPSGVFSYLDAAGQRACVIDEVGVITCWKEGEQVTFGEGEFTSVAVGRGDDDFLCATLADQSARCWDIYPEPGAEQPSISFDGTGWTKVVAGFQVGCALRPDHESEGITLHQMYCFGPNLTHYREDVVDLALSRRSVCRLMNWGALLCETNAIGSWTTTHYPDIELHSLSANGRGFCGLDDGGAPHCWDGLEDQWTP